MTDFDQNRLNEPVSEAFGVLLHLCHERGLISASFDLHVCANAFPFQLLTINAERGTFTGKGKRNHFGRSSKDLR